MNKNYSLIFIASTVSFTLILILVFTLIKSERFTAKPATDLKPEVSVLLELADKKNKEARTLITKKNPQSSDLQRAKILLQESIENAKEATEIQPDNPKTWTVLGLLYKQLIDVNPKNITLAEDAFKKALALSPDSPNLYNELASVLMEANKYSEAESMLIMAIRLNRLNPNYHYKLGNVYTQLAEFDKAVSSYNMAKRLTPATASANLLMIDAQMRKLETRAKNSSSAGNRQR